MKSFWKRLALWSAAVALLPLGCQKQTGEKTGEKIEEKAPALAADRPAEEPPPALAAAAAGIDLEDAPEYLHQIARHFGELNRIMKENTKDCAKGLAAIDKYIKENQAALEAMNHAAAQGRDKLSDTDKMKIAQQTAALLSPIMQEFSGVQQEFARNCPQELGSIAEMLKGLADDGK